MHPQAVNPASHGGFDDFYTEVLYRRPPLTDTVAAMPRLRGSLLLVLLFGLLFAVPQAHAVRGAGFTTINTTADGLGAGKGEGLCHNGQGSVNCNQYFSERFVWLNGGPAGNSLSDGTYFFAILVPGFQNDPNDQVPVKVGDKNLSDDFDTYKNRTFTVKNGNIDTYAGAAGQTPHDFGVDTADDGEKKIRAFPYSKTTNNGGVYILAICSLEPDRKGNTYPVKSQACKYDAFKIDKDEVKPECPKPSFGVNAFGQKTATQNFTDAGGIDLIEIINVTNASIAPLQPGENWFQGTTSWIELIATKIEQLKPATIEIYVRDVAGNEVRCDPVLTTLRVGVRAARAGRTGPTIVQRFRVTQHEDTITIQNGRRGLTSLTATVNGRSFRVGGLRPGARRTLHIGKALHRGRRSTVVLRGRGPAGARANVMIAN